MTKIEGCFSSKQDQVRVINWSPLGPGLEEIYIQDMHCEIMTPGP